MENQAAKTARSPMIQVALEQLVPAGKRVVHDPVAYQLLPPAFKGLVSLCRVDPLRRALLGLVDRQMPGIHGGILCRKRFLQDNLLAALEAGIRSVVILGAGFDTLAHRLPELGVGRVYEVDLPPIIQSKQVDLQRA